MSSAKTGAPGNETLTVEEFTDHPDVKDCLNRLHQKFTDQNPLIVSDVLDDDNHQYVNLVQKGGGVLGVALVGYTYILEQMGIRFLRLAGTSAGAINTALMTVIRQKQDPKSDEILRAICDLNFFELVDGHPAAKWVIRNFITNKDFTVKLKSWITWSLVIFALLVFGDLVLFGLEKKIALISIFTRLLFVLTGFYILLVLCAGYYLVGLFKRLKNAGYGINPGDFFYDWIKEQLLAHGVTTVSDLLAKASALPKLHLRTEHPMGLKEIKGDVTFITSELVTQNKIQFPEMCYLFRKKDDINSLSPAGFIRASMSIPLFFESYMINDIPCKEKEIIDAWRDKLGQAEPPSSARFVDGGILSNFPISLFYNPKVTIPRVPSLGIDLDDSKPEDKSMTPTRWTLGGYLGRMFNTIRFYYDKDFLLKNKVYEKGIGKIDVSDFNWLNFFITKQDKITMLVSGAKAATEFLLKFDWNDYKGARTGMQIEMNNQQAVADGSAGNHPENS